MESLEELFDFYINTSELDSKKDIQIKIVKQVAYGENRYIQLKKIVTAYIKTGSIEALEYYRDLCIGNEDESEFEELIRIICEGYEKTIYKDNYLEIMKFPRRRLFFNIYGEKRILSIKSSQLFHIILKLLLDLYLKCPDEKKLLK